MTWTYSAPVRHLIWIPMADGSESMIDAVDVVSITMRKVPGAPRHMPGGVTVQGSASYDVTFRFRSGATDRMTLCEEAWNEMREIIKTKAMP